MRTVLRRGLAIWLAGVAAWSLAQAFTVVPSRSAFATQPAAAAAPPMLLAGPPEPRQSAAPAAASPVLLEPTPLAHPPGPPAVGRIQIPAAGVDATIEKVMLDRTGAVDVPSRPDRVGWYGGGSPPGAAGDAVLDGHLDSLSGAAVFAGLARLEPGARVTVDWNGHRLTYVVDAIASYAFDAHPPGLFATDGPSRLSLITCAGAWDELRQTYARRLVVSARLA